MKKRLLSLSLAAGLLLSGCGAYQAPPEEDMTIVATTYPIYLFARELTAGVEGITVERLDTGSTSCLHDYNLTVNDMKKLERADVIALNGVGLEEFLHDALSTSRAALVDCSQGVELLENLSHHHHEEGEEEGHDHGHFDAHIWMDPANAMTMVDALGSALGELDEGNAPLYGERAAAAREKLGSLQEEVTQVLGETQAGGLITFHDGFHYFAHAFDLPLLESIEEEAGSEASAREIVEITALVKEHDLPVIFTEVNGSDATARAITRETGCSIAQLSMVMDGPAEGDINTYCQQILHNAQAICEGFGREEGVSAP